MFVGVCWNGGGDDPCSVQLVNDGPERREAIVGLGWVDLT